jgi:hypothetical protein
LKHFEQRGDLGDKTMVAAKKKGKVASCWVWEDWSRGRTDVRTSDFRKLDTSANIDFPLEGRGM